MSSANRDSFLFLFELDSFYIFFSCLIVLTRISSTLLKGSAEVIPLPCFWSYGRSIQSFTIEYVRFQLSVRIHLCYAEVVSFYSYSWVFLIMELCLICSHSCSSINMNMSCLIFILLMHTLKFIDFHMLKDPELQEEFLLDYVVK